MLKKFRVKQIQKFRVKKTEKIVLEQFVLKNNRPIFPTKLILVFCLDSNIGGIQQNIIRNVFFHLYFFWKAFALDMPKIPKWYKIGPI